MPYDFRPVSEGGNGGIDDAFSRKAPKGKYRLVCVDIFDGTDWVKDDYENLLDAQKEAKESSGEMLKVHIYDDKGNHL